MKSNGWFPYSLKAKILLAVGSLIVILMFIISISIIFQWRQLIINHQMENTKELTQAFSIPMLDALIYSENDDDYYEPHLRSQIQDFSEKASNLCYIMLTDNANRIIAHSDFTLYNQTVNDTVAQLLARSQSSLCMIYEHPESGWIIEAAQPLQIAGKRWGCLRVAVSAEPIRAEIRLMFIRLYTFTLILLVLTLTVIYYLLGRLTDSLYSLVHDIDRIDLNSEEFIDKEIGNDEIGILTRHFRALEVRLSQSRTQLLNAQSQVFQAEKLASIGRLASGVAHEINNPLNGIRNCVYSIQQEPDNRQLSTEYFSLIEEGIGQIESIVKKLLGFARNSQPQIKKVNLNHAVESVARLLDYQICKKGIQTDKILDPNLPEIDADIGLIQEVIMNLLLNSYDAVSENGKISIVTGSADEDNIFFSIEDNGIGISQEQQKHIFDPFFTTKEQGEGTGLGLSVSLGIVESHGGKFTVDSRPGNGSRFTVTLPIKGQA